LRRVLVLGVEHHAHRALDHLGGKLRGLPHLGSILNRRSLLKIRGGSNLNAGQSLSFAVGRGTNDYSRDSTGLTATVTAVPEPGTVALMLAGMGVVASVARRRGVAAR
ncbi:MAG: PEP-CTERM sorting domain-containing protein, partial [Burkholderiaceae bacterium]|nr:PEP-CTERM sorting domain-containing protein [Burkholderiaceae bacterium]